MTSDEYLKKSAEIHGRLKSLQDQLNGIAGIAPLAPGVRTQAVEQLLHRKHAIIAELGAVDEEFWCA